MLPDAIEDVAKWMAKFVSMHLMVLGASRLRDETALVRLVTVSMHLMVLGASRRAARLPGGAQQQVSMHLMVLGASRQGNGGNEELCYVSGLNAPDGAGCFPTAEWVPGIGFWQGLNAPDGAGCFPTYDKDFKGKEKPNVSMHLMVLGASRPDSVSGDPGSRTVSMHLMVLGASRLLCWKELSSSYWWSQCT